MTAYKSHLIIYEFYLAYIILVCWHKMWVFYAVLNILTASVIVILPRQQIACCEENSRRHLVTAPHGRIFIESA